MFLCSSRVPVFQRHEVQESEWHIVPNRKKPAERLTDKVIKEGGSLAGPMLPAVLIERVRILALKVLLNILFQMTDSPVVTFELVLWLSLRHFSRATGYATILKKK